MDQVIQRDLRSGAPIIFIRARAVLPGTQQLLSQWVIANGRRMLVLAGLSGTEVVIIFEASRPSCGM